MTLPTHPAFKVAMSILVSALLSVWVPWTAMTNGTVSLSYYPLFDWTRFAFNVCFWLVLCGLLHWGLARTRSARLKKLLRAAAVLGVMGAIVSLGFVVLFFDILAQGAVTGWEELFMSEQGSVEFVAPSSLEEFRSMSGDTR